MGFSVLEYGYEAWDDKLLKYVRKGSTLKTNVRSLIMTMRHGIRVKPNNIVGMEPEDFESIRRMMVAWEVLGIVAGPFLFTPYPGSDVYFRNRGQMLVTFRGFTMRGIKRMIVVGALRILRGSDEIQEYMVTAYRAKKIVAQAGFRDIRLSAKPSPLTVIGTAKG